MVTLSCPWCDEGARIPLTELAEPGASFTCAECGTCVAVVDEEDALETAA